MHKTAAVGLLCFLFNAFALGMQPIHADTDITAFKGTWSGRWGAQTHSTLTVDVAGDGTIEAEYCFKDECWYPEIEVTDKGIEWGTDRRFTFQLKGKKLKGRLKDRNRGRTWTVSMKRTAASVGFADQNAQDDFLISNVTLFNGDEIIDNTSILVEDGKIAKIQSNIVGDYERVDGEGKFLMSAMTNSHTHVWKKKQLREAAKAGVLNMLDMLSFDVRRLKQFRDTPGYARFYTSGYAATAPGGHGTQYSPNDDPAPTIETTADIVPFIRNRLANDADYIKIIVEPWRNTLSHMLTKEIIEEAHEHDKMAVVHISLARDAYKTIENGADGIMHIWTDRMSAHRLKSLRKKHDFFIVPTLLVRVTSPWVIKRHGNSRRMTKRHYFKELRKIYDADITILAGTDPPNNKINFGTDLYKEMLYFSEAGMPNIEVLKTATSNPAKAFESLTGTGHIGVGRSADMILLDKNPVDDMENINSIVAVWKMGIKVDLQ